MISSWRRKLTRSPSNCSSECHVHEEKEMGAGRKNGVDLPAGRAFHQERRDDRPQPCQSRDQPERNRFGTAHAAILHQSRGKGDVAEAPARSGKSETPSAGQSRASRRKKVAPPTDDFPESATRKCLSTKSSRMNRSGKLPPHRDGLEKNGTFRKGAASWTENYLENASPCSSPTDLSKWN